MILRIIERDELIRTYIHYAAQDAGARPISMCISAAGFLRTKLILV